MAGQQHKEIMLKILWENIKWDGALAGRHLVWETCRTVGGGAVMRLTKQASVFHPEEVDRIWYEVKAPAHLQHLEICDNAACSVLYDEPFIPFDCLSQAVRFANQHAQMKPRYLNGRIEGYSIAQGGE
jgi:hypothetical protein